MKRGVWGGGILPGRVKERSLRGRFGKKLCSEVTSFGSKQPEGVFRFNAKKCSEEEERLLYLPPDKKARDDAALVFYIILLNTCDVLRC